MVNGPGEPKLVCFRVVMLNYTASVTSTETDSQFERIGSNEIGFIRLLHPSTDGYVAFAVGDEDGMVPRLAVRSDKLLEYIPRQLNRDSYISVNESFRLKRKKGSKDTVCGEPVHRTDTLRYLCAAYTDLDVYNAGLSVETATDWLADLADQGVIPKPSMLVFSGRGIWPVWLLRDELNFELPPRTRKDGVAIAFHSAIQLALFNRLVSLGADRVAASPVRYLRMPGSLNTKSGTVVRWQLWNAEESDLFRYTLTEMAERLGVKTQRTIAKPSTPKQPVRSGDEGVLRHKRGRPGWEALRARRLRDFRQLWSIRKCFRKGCRSNAILYYAWLLAQHAIPREKAMAEVLTFNSTCRPPLPQNQVTSAVNSAYKRKYPRICDQTIADWLDITPEEASHLTCKVFATRFQRRDDIPAPKVRRADADRARLTARRAAMERIIADEAGKMPSTRRMVTLLAERGVKAGHVTISKDYRALGLKVA